VVRGPSDETLALYTIHGASAYGCFISPLSRHLVFEQSIKNGCMPLFRQAQSGIDECAVPVLLYHRRGVGDCQS
jgi:hypothetical protein